MIIRQLCAQGSHTWGTGNLHIYDFCRSKSWGTTDRWLNNRAYNGWAWDYNPAYTNFILRLIK